MWAEIDEICNQTATSDIRFNSMNSIIMEASRAKDEETQMSKLDPFDYTSSFDNLGNDYALMEASKLAMEKQMEVNEQKIAELQRAVEKQEIEADTQSKEMMMKPLMLFLSSSLNTELVYTILHGITKFTLLNYMRNEFSKEQMQQFKAMEYRVDQFGDTTITLRKIKIENIERWDRMSYDKMVAKGGMLDLRKTSDILETDRRRSTIMGDNATVIDKKTEITYH